MTTAITDKAPQSTTLDLARAIDAHQAALLRFARSILGRHDLAQDAVQEACLLCLRQGPALEGLRSPFAWLMHVTRNVSLNMKRQEKRMDRTAAEARREAESAGAAPGPADAESLERVREAVIGLPETQREVLRLKLWEGLTYREIGERTGMTLTNVSYHAGQALKALADRLRAKGLGKEESGR